MKNLKTSLLIIALVSIGTNVSAQDSGQEKQGGKPPSAKEIFKKMDHNQDNLISVDEAEGPLKNNFYELDLDGDGFISKDELKQAPKPGRKRE